MRTLEHISDVLGRAVRQTEALHRQVQFTTGGDIPATGTATMLHMAALIETLVLEQLPVPRGPPPLPLPARLCPARLPLLLRCP